MSNTNGKTMNRNKISIIAQNTRYETFESTLEQYPNTVLGDKEKRMKYFDKRLGALYFDVRPALFDSVLFFYQSNGILSKPGFTSDVEYKKTLEFFGLLKTIKQKDLPENPTLKEKIWDFLENPHKSKIRLYVAYLSFFVIVASVTMYCWETVVYKEKASIYRFSSFWFVGECVYISFFTVEYIVRLICAPNRFDFVFSFLGLVDGLSVIPFYVSVISSFYTKIYYVRILRLLQIARIIKLSRYNNGLRILAHAILGCRRQMFSLFILFLIAITLGSTCVYFCESPYDTEGFGSIPESMWYSVITMTTVGYGDVVPKTALGKLFGTLSIFIGTVTLFHFFLPIYLSYFSYYYAEEKDRIKHEHDRKIHKNKIPSPNRSLSYSPKKFESPYKSGSLSSQRRLSMQGCSNSMEILVINNNENFHLTVPVRSFQSGASSFSTGGNII